MKIEEVYGRYRKLLRMYIPATGRILKTDCFNEGIGDFRNLGAALDIGGMTTYLEIDPAIIARAEARHPGVRDLRQGDIRELPFYDETFKALFDLSTIDHVPPSDASRAIDEYWRVLVPGGRLVLVAWCSTERRDEPTDWGDGPQYFLNEADLLEAMEGKFCVESNTIIHTGDEVYLHELIARRI